MKRAARALAGLVALVLLGAGVAAAQPSGTLTFGVHVTLATRWLDPADTDAEITPFMIFYALHDALVKPMPGALNTPSLAESWTMSPDGRTWDFVLRKGTRFHNGEPVTAEDVKFSFADQVVFAPIWENGFIRAYGARVEEAGLKLIPAFPYSAPLEDLRLKPSAR